MDGRLGRDPFLASEPDTAKCNALGTLYISWTQDFHSLLWVQCKGGRSLVFVRMSDEVGILCINLLMHYTDVICVGQKVHCGR